MAIFFVIFVKQTHSFSLLVYLFIYYVSFLCLFLLFTFLRLFLVNLILIILKYVIYARFCSSTNRLNTYKYISYFKNNTILDYRSLVYQELFRLCSFSNFLSLHIIKRLLNSASNNSLA